MTEPGTSSVSSSPPPDQGGRPSRCCTRAAPELRYSVGRTGIARPTELTALARELAVQSRREQGLPDKITDPAALERGAQLLLALRGRRERPPAGVPP
jgi:hypothetical protein